MIWRVAWAAISLLAAPAHAVDITYSVERMLISENLEQTPAGIEYRSLAGRMESTGYSGGDSLRGLAAIHWRRLGATIAPNAAEANQHSRATKELLLIALHDRAGLLAQQREIERRFAEVTAALAAATAAIEGRRQQ